MNKKVVVSVVIIVSILTLGYLGFVFFIKASVDEDFRQANRLIDEGMALADTTLKQYGSNLSNPWREKFAPILADTNKAELSAGYVIANAKIMDVVNYIDETLMLLNADERQKNTELVNQLMIVDGRAAELKIRIFDALFLIEFFEFWNEEDKEILKKTIPLSLEYGQGTEKEKPSWETYHFDSVPLIVAKTLLNKFRNDALSTRDVVLELIYTKATTAPINQ